MNKKTKWFLGIFFGLILLILIAWQLVKNFKIEKFLEEKAQTELNKLWPNRVAFDFDDLTFQFFSKNASISNVRLTIFSESGADTLANLKIERITANWASYKDFFTDDTIKVKAIKLNKVFSDVPFDFEKLKPKAYEDAGSSTPFKIAVGDIILSNSELNFYKERGEQTGQFTSAYELVIQDVFYDSEKEFKPAGGGIGAVELKTSAMDYYLPDGFYRVQIRNTIFRPLVGEAQINDVLLKPVYDWKEFAAKKEVLTSYIALKIDSIQLKDIALPKGMIKAAIAEEIRVYQPSLSVLRDKNYILPDDRFVPIIIDQLEGLELPVFIRKVLVENMFIEYIEKPEGKQSTGKITFNDLTGTIRHFTNIADSVEALDASLEILASAKVFNKAVLSAEIVYGLQTENGDFSATGSLEPMQLTAFNDFIGVVLPVNIQEGQNDGVYFTFSGTRYSTTGRMRFRYSDLKINVDSEKIESQFIRNSLAFLANVALPKFNPRPNGKFRVGQINFERDTRKSMFNYWSQSLVTGFKSTLGASAPAEIEQNRNSNEEESFWNKLGFGKNKDKN
ncbi:hypothetical protein C9994_07560 [Marivirga lumbricoides]|uniref:DUF748 domain-containing protein n=1 Tax=Marivirga lumbricoides TaxID=1046115 RepID=A0A2T4DRN2_9BACT|nr:hypothetical protein C9994_07560 [Marivirga lumbricoides]